MQGGGYPPQGGGYPPQGGAPIPPPQGGPSGYPPQGGPGYGGPGYGGPGYQGPGAGQGTTNPSLLLGLGIFGLLCCQIVGVVNFFLATNALKTIDAGGAPESERGTANVARILGIISMVLMVLGIIARVILISKGGVQTGGIR